MIHTRAGKLILYIIVPTEVVQSLSVETELLKMHTNWANICICILKVNANPGKWDCSNFPSLKSS